MSAGRYIGIGAVAGAAIPLGAFFLSFPLGIFPTWLWISILCLCPSYIMFMGTAACEPFDKCSLTTLAFVLAANVLLYAIVATYLWVTKLKHRWLRPAGLIAVLGYWIATWHYWTRV